MKTSSDGAGHAGFDEYVRTRVHALTRTAYLLTGDRHHAEDLVQTALLRAAGRWTRIEDPDAYVRRVLYTQAVSWWRSRRRRPEVLLASPGTGSDGDHPLTATGGRGPDPDPELRITLARALARLTPRQRAVLVLRFYEDRSESETAALLEIGVGTVKSQTRHALRRLRVIAPELLDLSAEEVPVR